MPLSDIEKEIVFIKAVQELIDEMINYEVLGIIGSDPDSFIQFSSMTHKRFFNIILVDFLSQTDKNIKALSESISYLGALKRICANPKFKKNNSIESLRRAVTNFIDWLNQEVEVEVWLPTADIEAKLKIKRIEFIKICGNISKHSFSRLSGVAKDLISIFSRNNITITQDDAILLLDDFYEKFHTDILDYHGSTIAEFLNEIRWGIHEYLYPEYCDSKVDLGGDPPKYKYTYPSEVITPFCKTILNP